MAKCRVKKDDCSGCQLCVSVCPVEAIHMSEEGYAVIDPQVCTGCEECKENCPVEAIETVE